MGFELDPMEQRQELDRSLHQHAAMLRRQGRCATLCESGAVGIGVVNAMSSVLHCRLLRIEIRLLRRDVQLVLGRIDFYPNCRVNPRKDWKHTVAQDTEENPVSDHCARSATGVLFCRPGGYVLTARRGVCQCCFCKRAWWW